MLERREQVFVARLVHEGELAVLEGLCDLFQQRACRLVAKCLLQHGTRVLDAALGDRLVGHAHLVELGEDFLCDVRVEEAKLGDLERDHLDLLRVHVLVKQGSLLNAQRDNHSGSLLRAGQLACAGLARIGVRRRGGGNRGLFLRRSGFRLCALLFLFLIGHRLPRPPSASS